MAALPVARLSTPTDMVRLVPHLCGFVPAESLVVVSLRGPRRRVGLTIRVDLPPPDDVPDLAADLAARLAWDGATEALVLVYTEEGEALARSELVASVTDALAGTGVGVQEALLVRDGRWWSYTCTDDRCCPATGVPIAGPASAALGLVEATQALEGRAVLPSREELVQSLRPPAFLAAAAAGQALQAAAEAWAAYGAAGARRRDAVEALRAAVRRAADPRAPVADVARLVTALGDVRVRDEVLTWVASDEGPLLDLLLRLAADAVAPYDAPVCTLIAIVSWCRGDGALANVALDRAWESDPAYSLAALVREGLAAQIPPAAVRQWLARC